MRKNTKQNSFYFFHICMYFSYHGVLLHGHIFLFDLYKDMVYLTKNPLRKELNAILHDVQRTSTFRKALKKIN